MGSGGLGGGFLFNISSFSLRWESRGWPSSLSCRVPMVTSEPYGRLFISPLVQPSKGHYSNPASTPPVHQIRRSVRARVCLHTLLQKSEAVIRCCNYSLFVNTSGAAMVFVVVLSLCGRGLKFVWSAGLNQRKGCA